MAKMRNPPVASALAALLVRDLVSTLARNQASHELAAQGS